MLEKPDIQDEVIISRLHDDYEPHIVQIDFLPLGADFNTAVYRASADDGAQYFLKLRRGAFDEIVVTVPKFLNTQGIWQVMPPIETKTHQLWSNLGAYTLILYPFVEGYSGIDVKLTDRQWIEFGATLKRIHTAVLTPELAKRLQQETYSPQWRETVKRFLANGEIRQPHDSAAQKLATFMTARHDEIMDIVDRAEELCRALEGRDVEFVLCHADIHDGNLLLGKNEELYIVDWDNPILAAKERDLMFVGGGCAGVWHGAREEALFYQGYGETEIDRVVLAYYRYERIVQDFAAYSEQLFLTAEGGEDRELGVHYFMSNFLPNNVIEIAQKTYQRMMEASAS